MGGTVFGGFDHHVRRSARRALAALAPLLFVLFAAPPAAAAESWSDPNLTVHDGLELWLDAGRATGEEPLSTDGLLAAWRDASGRGRHVSQSSAEAQPKRIVVGDSAIVRFDGVNDHLRAVGQATTLKSFTLFIVAAPWQNVGTWRGLVAFNAPNERDYASGLNVDLGSEPSAKFSTLNVEGRGFQGMLNLRSQESSFGRLQTLVISSDNAAKSLRLVVDGQSEGERSRSGEPISMEEITIGARHFSAFDGKVQPNGFGREDIAEVLVFNRLLSEQEIDEVQKYLDAKYSAVKDSIPPPDDETAEQLVPIENPPAVQVFAPGFAVRELPIDLTNINNIKYRPDGTLVALGYDGRVWLLRDTNNDGLEDEAEIFWDNPIGLRSAIGMDLTPPNYEHGEGLFVVGKTQCLLIVDTDQDGRADKEIEIAGGWKEGFTLVDGLGVAFDKRDNSIFYGRATYNFMAPLLPDKDGNPEYSVSSEGGAIHRISPDFKSREVVASGIRVPVGLRINRHGDLFASDQEGATWVPNGNPFDELLHIQRGRHYGFPARHPQHLPDVIDEPSTFDYGPQHQSNCGLNFNEPVVAGGPVFGPQAWADDVFLAGYSRGKLYRTQLVKSSVGYVARTQLLGCLKMLTVDACIGPAGEMVVACHSGGPDWGSGPTGKGKLFKIVYSDPEHPQVVLAWPVRPRELRVEFDRPVEPQLLREVLAQSKLTAGEFVRAGDRFESLWPGYAIVQGQKAAARFDVPLRSAQLTPDRRTLVLATDPMTRASHFALMLPGMGRPMEGDDGRVSDAPGDTPLAATGSASATARDDASSRRRHKKALAAEPVAHTRAEDTLPQHASLDLDFDLSGCEATWTPADGGPAWTGWLPHFDLDVARRLTAGSAPHDELWSSMNRPGDLVLRAKLDLTDMLRPAVQPGAKIDYEFPPETVTVTFETAAPGAKLALQAPSTDADDSEERSRVNYTSEPDAKSLVPVELRLTSVEGPPKLVASWITNEDDRPRPLPLRRIFIPWAERNGEKLETDVVVRIPELEGGSWARGYHEFFGEKAACSKCHAIHGRGGDIGPDLSNLVHRDYASVLRDITHPSFAINPDHLTYTAILGDGRVLSGVVRTSGDTTSIGDANGKIVEVATSDIEELAPSGISTMPEGVAKALGEDALRDLLTFLLTAPPQMPRDHAGPRPKPRPIAAVNAALAGAPDPAEKTRPIKLVLVAGPKDHEPGEHDYPAWQKAWAELFGAASDVEVSTAWEWPTQQQFEQADVMVFYQHGDWTAERAADIDPYLKRGGGLVYIHWALDGRQMGREFAERIGLAALGGGGFRHGEIALKFSDEIEHPITRNYDTLMMHDETYWNLAGELPANRVLATAVEEGAVYPQLWTMEPHSGRVFVSIPGHYSWTFDDPLFRVLLLRGIAWAAKEPVDRFNELVWPGAEVAK